MKDERIYFVSAISLEEITEEKLKNMYEVHKVRYDKPNLSYEDFLRLKKSWKEDEYLIDSFISSYHLDKEEAIKYAINNIGDINEAGSYPYAGVTSAPVGCSYYYSYHNEEDFLLYKFNYESSEYEPLDKNAKEYERLLHHLWQIV